MNARERFLETLLFGRPDKIPLIPGNGRKSTRENWYKQGLPKNVKNIAEYAYKKAGGTDRLPNRVEQFGVNERMIPEFKEKIIEKKKNTQIVQDWKGNICEIGNEFTIEHLRSAIDFVTRRWIKCPVENHSDWEDMKKRYNADDPSRFPANAKEWAKKLEKRDCPLRLSFPGPFWQIREWVGFENLCTLLCDDPDFIKEMILFWEDYIAQLMEKHFEHVLPDLIHISEDMAYKGSSMISPDMTREFLFPTWKRWGTIIKEAGVPVYDMDSDGFIGELIPLWIEAGINVCDPIEVAAGNDIVEFRNRFGNKMAYRDGIDKRAIAKGGITIEKEIKRIAPVIHDNGYIPSCDHGVPSDVSWPNFVYYTKLLAEECGWL